MKSSYQTKIKIGVSSCLVGEKVRWDSGHKQDQFVCEVLGRYFEYVPICPEVEVGMGTPREAVALYGTLEKPRLISRKTRTDWTKRMGAFSRNLIDELKNIELCGYIFKSKSPSCGPARVPVYFRLGSDKATPGHGVFASAFIEKFPLVPVEDEDRLKDPRVRENFIVRVFSYQRFQHLFNQRFSLNAWVNFHAQHQILLLAHSRKHFAALEKLMANAALFKPSALKDKYGRMFMEALAVKSSPKKNADVLLRMMSFLKKVLSKGEMEEVLIFIEDCRNGSIPLVVPVTLIRHHAKKHNIESLLDQAYLNPHPVEQLLRNRV